MTCGLLFPLQWDLVCDNSYLVETSQTVMVVGVMFGAMFFSAMSDNFGRKPVFLFSEWAMVIVGITTAFVDNYYLFAVLRFCAGALQQVNCRNIHRFPYKYGVAIVTRRVVRHVLLGSCLCLSKISANIGKQCLCNASFH